MHYSYSYSCFLSYFPLQIVKVTEICQKLLSDQRLKVTTADIGIIAAFRSQVMQFNMPK
jgi:hypothetical protein